jgi:hypothetical protein
MSYNSQSSRFRRTEEQRPDDHETVWGHMMPIAKVDEAMMTGELYPPHDIPTQAEEHVPQPPPPLMTD